MTLTQALLDWIADTAARARAGTVPVLMLSGPQGCGKTTLLSDLRARADLRLLCLSLDDFYLSAAERRALAADISPLFETRGPPGTHDLALLGDILDRADGGKALAVPQFDKRADDRLPVAGWQKYYGPFDAVLLEGWCLGAHADLASLAEPPLNAVEEQPGAEAWRRYQENMLAGVYAALFDRAAGFAHLDAPAFDDVYRWRAEQECQTLGADALSDAEDAELRRFISHFERITRRMLAGGRRGGLVLALDPQRRLTG